MNDSTQSQSKNPKRIGKYRIVAELGRGGMGVVYLAEDTNLDRPVAIKVLPRGLQSDSRFIELFSREAKTIARLSHPNIVHVHAFEVVDELPVIEMEYIDGGSFAHLLETEFVSVEDVVRYARDIAEALSYCHNLGAVHRDIKPSNILVNHYETAKLSDFGIAKALSESEHLSVNRSWTGVFVGTPQYAPPEAWAGESATPLWDIYSLGAVMYEALSGELPHSGSSFLELARAVASSRPSPLMEKCPHVSEELSTLVMATLEHKPERRLESADVFLERIKVLPEASQVSQLGQTAVPRKTSVRDISRVGYKADRGQSSFRRTSGVVFGAVVAILMILALWVYSSNISTQPNDPSTTALAAARSPRPETAVATQGRTPASNSRMYEATYYVNDVSETRPWLVTLDENAKPAFILACSASEIARCILTWLPNEELYYVEGDWAAYVDVSGTVVRYGTIEGWLDLDSVDQVMTGKLQRHCANDGHEDDLLVTARSTDTHDPEHQMARFMESSPYVIPLIFNEVVPRNVPWIDHVLTAFASGADTIDAPQLADIDEATLMKEEGAINALYDLLVQSVPNEVALKGAPNERNSILRLATTDSALLLGFECDDLPNVSNANLSVNLLTQYRVPVSGTPDVRVIHNFASGETRIDSPANAAAANRCRLWTRREGARVWGVGIVPFELSGRPVSIAGRIVPWRITIAIRSENDSENPTDIYICRWGPGDDEPIRHGILLQFGD